MSEPEEADLTTKFVPPRKDRHEYVDTGHAHTEGEQPDYDPDEEFTENYPAVHPEL